MILRLYAKYNNKAEWYSIQHETEVKNNKPCIVRCRYVYERLTGIYVMRIAKTKRIFQFQCRNKLQEKNDLNN